MQSNGLSQPYTRGQKLPELLKQRILILDGAMGTMIQQYKLTEADYRGLPGNTRFADHPGIALARGRRAERRRRRRQEAERGAA